MRHRNLHIIRLMAMIIAIFSFSFAKADTFIAVVSGSWNSSATWGGSVPPTTIISDNISIPAGITVTMDENVELNGPAATLDVNGSLEGSAESLIVSEGTLSGLGSIDVFTMTYGEYAIALFAGDIDSENFINSQLDLLIASTIMVHDTLNLWAGSILLDTGSSIELDAGSTVKITDGELILQGGVFQASNSYNVMVEGSSSNLGVVVSGSGLTDLHINLNSSMNEAMLETDVNVAGMLTLEQGTLSLEGYDLTISGDLAANVNGSINANEFSSVHIMSSTSLSGELNFSSGSESVDTLSINISDGGHVMLGSDVVVEAYLNTEEGSLGLNTYDLTIEGDIAMDANGSIMGNTESGITLIAVGNLSGGLNFKAGFEDLDTLNINISNEGYVMLESGLTIDSYLNLENGSLMLNSNHFSIEGDIAGGVNGSIASDANADISINSDNSLTGKIMLDEDANSINMLNVNIENGGSVMLGSEASIEGELMLQNGMLEIENENLEIMTGAEISGQGETSYIMTSGEGSLIMHVEAGGSAKLYPLGTSISYAPVMLAQASGSSSADFNVRVINNVYSEGYSGTDLSETEAVVDHTWFIESETAADLELDVQLEWTENAEVNGFNRNNAYVEHYMNGMWNTEASGAATITARGTYAMTAESVTELSPFAVMGDEPTGIEDQIAEDSFIVYPNPVGNKPLSIELGNRSIENAKIRIYNLNGQLVLTKEFIPTSDKTINVDQLERGTYFIHLISENEEYRTRFVK